MAILPFNLKRFFSFKSILRLFAALIVLMSIIVVSLPLWLGWALKTYSPKEIVQFESYETQGYGHFKLRHINVTHPQAEVQIDELVGLTPVIWLKQATFGGWDQDYLTMGELIVTLPEDPPLDSDSEGTPSTLPQNLPEAIRFIETYLLKTDKWLPQAHIQKAVIIRGNKRIELGAIEWRNRSLGFEGTINDFPNYPFHVSLILPEGTPTLELTIPSAEINLKSSVAETGTKLVANTILVFRENTAFLEATFGENSWSPDSASWNLSNWALNLNSLGLNSAYSDLEFNLLGGWQEGSVTNTLDGHLSTEDETPIPYLPPVDFTSEVGGNAQSLSLSRFSLDAPGINARITDPVQYNLQEMQLAGDLRFDIDLDLSILNRDDLQGRMTGLLHISTKDGNPIGQFALQGAGVKVKSLDFEELDIQANLEWPRLQLDNVTAKLTTGSSFQAQALMDLQARTISDASMDGILTRESLAEFLPEDLSLETITFTAKSSGSFETIQHSGSLQVDSIETSTFKPLSASLSWSGRTFDLETLELHAHNEESDLSIKASGNLSASLMRWEISQLDLASQGNALAALTAPATLQIDRTNRQTVQLENFILEGPGGKLSAKGLLQYPNSANLEVQANHLETNNWVNPWLKEPLPKFQIESVTASANWDEGPIQFETAFIATLAQDERPVNAKGRLSSNGAGIHFEAVEISDSLGPWITVSGDAPISLHPTETEKLHISREAPLNLTFSTSESQNWLDWLSRVSPFSMEKFNSQVQLAGSLNDLKGNFDLEVITQKATEEHGMPATTIQAKGAIDDTLLSISSMTVSVLEERFVVSGSLRLPEALIEKIENPAVEVPWQQTAFNIQIPPSKLSPMRYFAPQLLGTGGEIEADLQGSIADGLAGFLKIKGVNTRAIFPFGSLRNVSADLEFQSSQATLKNISAYIGREPITLSGSLDYRDWNQPNYNFTIAGNDLPLLRKPGLLLRSDLDLAINKVANKPTTITGTVILKDGLFLLNRSTILGGGSAGGRNASTRPPYFSVDIPPLSQWELDVVVKGDEFIRLKTPAADGVLSLDMKLQGKLQEPFATGRVEFERGNIFFPFSSFKIDYGIMELPIDNPYSPTIEILGSSRRFGYDLGVEITGTAYNPQVHFTSNPPLSSEEVMLMVMTGKNPEGLFNYSATQRASTLGTYISKGLFASDDSGGNILSRLSLTSGENLSEQGKETMEIEFKLNERFQLISEYDEYDFWNTGLRWRIYTRHAVESEDEESTK